VPKQPQQQQAAAVPAPAEPSQLSLWSRVKWSQLPAGVLKWDFSRPGPTYSNSSSSTGAQRSLAGVLLAWLGDL
jgi:hypothetical protein